MICIIKKKTYIAILYINVKKRSNHACIKNIQLWTSVVRYLDTYRRYLIDDTSIAKVMIYRGISWQ